MKRNTILFLLIASLLYPLFGGFFGTSTIEGLQTYIILTPVYVYMVGWSAIELEKEIEKND